MSGVPVAPSCIGLMQQMIDGQNSLVNYQQSPGALLQGLSWLTNAAPNTPSKAERDEYAWSRLRAWVSDGEDILVRMAFWSAFGVFARPILNKLAEQLNDVSEQAEGWVSNIVTH